MKERQTFRILTHGCKVNQYESEALGEELIRKGLTRSDGASADIFIINTCTVTKEASASCRQTINKVIRDNPNAGVLVTGCFSQVYRDEIASINGVDYIGGSAEKLALADEALLILKNGKRIKPKINVLERPESAGFERTEISSFPRTRAYIKIEDGCNNRCSYCIIPTARGRVRSKDPKDVISEINLLTENKVPEIVLTGIETDAYGLDFKRYRLANLIEDIEKYTDAKRIRLGSMDPFTFTDDFIERVCTKEIMLPHYHISMQSGCSKTLREMRRRVNSQRASEVLSNIRAARRDVLFSADFIAGFPGETNEDFRETVDFIEKERFLHLHVFKYSIRDGTEAAERQNQVPGDIKTSRSRLMIDTAARIKSEILAENVGKCFPLLVETCEITDGGFRLTGHTPSFMEMNIISLCPVERGRIINVRAEGHDGSALTGRTDNVS